MNFVEPKVEILTIDCTTIVYASNVCTDGSSGGTNTCVNTGWGDASQCSDGITQPGWNDN